MKNSLILIALSLIITACGDPISPRLMAPPEAAPVKQALQLSSTSSLGVEFSFNPKVDILFVVDNSRSMENEIEILRENINKFVDKLSTNKILDYHIGVTTVYDSIRYIDAEEEVFAVNPNTGKRNYLEKGELLPLRDTNGQLMWNEPRYVTRDNLSQLKRMFDVEGVNKSEEFGLDVEFIDNNIIDEATGRYSVVAKGPAYEESFSPLREVFKQSSAHIQKANAGFIREDAHFVVFFLTDAEDMTPADGVLATKETHKNKTLETLALADLYSDILEVKKDPSKISAFGLLCPTSNRTCRLLNPDPKLTGGSAEEPAKRIHAFVKMVHSKQKQSKVGISQEIDPIIDISKEEVVNVNNEIVEQGWGDDIARIGESIRKKVMEKTIYISEQDRPAFNKAEGRHEIAVYYGEIALPENEVNGWTYDVITNSITIHGGIAPEVYEQENAKISIRYLKVDTNSKYTEKL